jgi:Hemerythrin HHE cation binding domain
VLWPALRATVAGHPDQVALVDALEAEHAVIEPLLGAVDQAGDGYGLFADIVDELVSKVSGHLAHEEIEGLDLIDASLSLEAWQRTPPHDGRSAND